MVVLFFYSFSGKYVSVLSSNGQQILSQKSCLIVASWRNDQSRFEGKSVKAIRRDLSIIISRHIKMSCVETINFWPYCRSHNVIRSVWCPYYIISWNHQYFTIIHEEKKLLYHILAYCHRMTWFLVYCRWFLGSLEYLKFKTQIMNH